MMGIRVETVPLRLLSTVTSGLAMEAKMLGNTLVAAPRQVLLEELRGLLNARVAAVEKQLRFLQGEFEKLALERIDLRAELQVLEEQMQKCKTEDKEK